MNCGHQKTQNYQLCDLMVIMMLMMNDDDDHDIMEVTGATRVKELL